MKMLKYLKIFFYFIFILKNYNVFCWPEYQLFTKKNLQEYQPLNPSTNIKSYLNSSSDTILLIHGFSSSADSKRIVLIKDYLLKNHDFNVIAIDWSEGAAAPNYLSAANNSKIVGKKISQFILNNQIDPKKIHCVGHSLGAHVKGMWIYRKKYKDSKNYWSGSSRNVSKAERLDKSDAELVDNIHTDAILGIQEAIGHKDFYPNGGKIQNGCGLSLKREINFSLEEILKNYSNNLNFDTDYFACNHIRCEYYFAESIDSECKFLSAACDSYENFKSGKCSCKKNGCSSMGFKANETSHMGIFFLDTTDSKPFCKLN